jgi:hypothetical protein
MDCISKYILSVLCALLQNFVSHGRRFTESLAIADSSVVRLMKEHCFALQTLLIFIIRRSHICDTSRISSVA